MIGLASANAFVLQRQPYREHSWLLRLFTAQEGQVHVISRSAEVVHLYQPYAVELQRRNNGWSIRDLMLAGKVLRIQGPASYAALYLNELCARLVPYDVPVTELFGSYYAALKALAFGEPEQPQLRFFESRLLQELGVGINTELCADHQPIAAELNYRFNGSHAFCVSAQGPYQGAWIKALSHQDFRQPEVLAMAAQVHREALQTQLAGRPLHSLALFQE